jgi:two-component system sensor histidine kinase LytS
LKIEKARFEDKLSINIVNEIEETVFVPPLIIQPIIENAIKHGILKKIDGGTISLKIFKEQNLINIIVTDDGIGIDKDNLEKIKKFDSNSVGINNVYRRLNTLFHENTSFEIISNIDIGTKVIITLPIVNKINNIGGLYD